jgi:hypothetical protein
LRAFSLSSRFAYLLFLFIPQPVQNLRWHDLLLFITHPIRIYSTQTSNELLTYITPGFVSGRLPSYSVLIKEDGIKILNMTIPFLSLLLVPASITVPYFYVVLDKPWFVLAPEELRPFRSDKHADPTYLSLYILGGLTSTTLPLIPLLVSSR